MTFVFVVGAERVLLCINSENRVLWELAYAIEPLLDVQIYPLDRAVLPRLCAVSSMFERLIRC